MFIRAQIFLGTRWGDPNTVAKRCYAEEFPHVEIHTFIKPNENIVDEVRQSNKKYLYITSNETIQGIQIKKFNNFKDKKLIIDMSSDICSYEFEWNNISYIFAGAQKNLGIPGVTICIFDKDFIQKEDLPSYMNINNHIDKNSTFNSSDLYFSTKAFNLSFSSLTFRKVEIS